MVITYSIQKETAVEGDLQITTSTILQHQKTGELSRVGTLRFYQEGLQTYRKELIFRGNTLCCSLDSTYLNEPESFPHYECMYTRNLSGNERSVAIVHEFFLGNTRYLEYDLGMYPVASYGNRKMAAVYDSSFSLQGTDLTYPVLARLQWGQTEGAVQEATLQILREVPQELCMAIILTLV